MLSNAQTYFYHSAWLVVLPGLAIVLTVLATNLLGNLTLAASETLSTLGSGMRSSVS